ncbi:MAG TPA: hypothetical protein VJO14_03555 [Bacteroidota bacterium]|nr:hypothetical protein [Bacteroidota bacterium]
MISIESAADTLRAGGSSEILLRFTPDKGFHVNAVPPVGFSLDPVSAATPGDSVIVPRDSSTGYMDLRRPVRLPFIMAKSLPAGPRQLRGTVTFYYCSDEEGWCRRVKRPFSLPLFIR